MREQVMATWTTNGQYEAATPGADDRGDVHLSFSIEAFQDTVRERRTDLGLVLGAEVECKQ
jgi:hypothetical protein